VLEEEHHYMVPSKRVDKRVKDFSFMIRVSLRSRQSQQKYFYLFLREKEKCSFGT